MHQYYLNTNQQPNGDYEVHKFGCVHGARPENQLYLGWFNNGIEAVTDAKNRRPDIASQINGCAYCSPESNTD